MSDVWARLSIESINGGGYVIRDGIGDPRFACSTMAEALKFIAAHLVDADVASGEVI
jgi:hypothetical protein